MTIGLDARCLMNHQYSGVSWYAFRLFEALFELDRENQYLLFYNSSRPVQVPAFGRPNAAYRGFHYPNKIFNFCLNFLNRPKLDKLIGGADVFFTPNLHFVAWSSRCRKVIAVHDLSFLRFPEFFTFKMRLWHRLILAKDILGDADVVLADSQNTKNDLMALLAIPEEKIRVIYPGVAKEFRVMAKSEAGLDLVKEKYRLPDEFIFYLGAPEPRKNVAGIIEAFNLMPGQNHLVIAGGGGWKNKNIHRLAKDNPRIHFLGYVAEDDKPALYNLAAVFVYPSFYEGFGLPLLEAMACGCPVIGGSNSSQVEVVADAGLLVDPHNINEIKEAMAVLLADKELRNGFIKLGLERAKQFTWQKTAAGVLGSFKE